MTSLEDNGTATSKGPLVAGAAAVAAAVELIFWTASKVNLCFGRVSSCICELNLWGRL